MEIRYNRGFIDVTASECDSVNSPRETSSDPGSVFSREASCSGSSFFQREHEYVKDLSLRLRKKKKNGFSVSSTNNETSDGTQTDSVDRLRQARDNDFSSESTMLSAQEANGCKANRLKPANSHMSTAKRSQVMQTILAKTADLRETLALQRLSAALTSINEIPEQVEQVLQQRTNDVSDLVQGNVTAMQGIMTSNDSSIQSIGVIPSLVKDSFRDSFALAMSSVRIHVDDVVQGLEAEGFGEANNEWVLQQIQSIPAEVRLITANAVERAVENSQEQVALQLGYARNRSTERPGLEKQLDHAQQMMVEVPSALAHDAAMAAESNVEQALGAVQGSTPAEKAMTNRVVADALLRAKATMAIQEALSLHNPGSIGHPELCSRPCLFFTQGKCTNGLACVFCHASHPKRAAHLDKRNREAFQRLEYSERFVLVAPVLRSKIEGLAGSEHLVRELDDILTDFRYLSSDRVKADRSKGTRDTRQLAMTLKCMSARSMLSLMQKDSHEYPTVEAFLQKCGANRRGSEGSNCGDVGDTECSDFSKDLCRLRWEA